MRGRTATWLVAAAVAVLATAAVVDAVVGQSSDPDPTPPPPPSRADERGVREEFLETERVIGRLLYTDEACRIRSLDLPEARRTPEPGLVGCRFTSSSDGTAGLDGFVVAPGGGVGAICRSETIELRTWSGDVGDPARPDGLLLGRRDGCAPAWRPDATLTAVREGEVRDLGQGGRGHERTVLSRRDLERLFGPPWNLTRPTVREIGWLDDSLLAAIVRDAAGGGDLLALLRGRRLVAATPSPYSELSRLRVSPRGTYAAAQIGDAPALVLLDREGEFVPVGLRGHAITWSRDEIWTALAAPDGIYVLATGGRANRFARIPIQARDVFWR